MKKFFVFALISVSVFIVAPGALAQSYQVSLVASDVKQTTVGATFEEGITIKNTGSADIPAGTLEIVLPSQLNPETTDPKHASRQGQKIVWNIPIVAAGEFYRVTYSVTAKEAGSALISTAIYKVGDATLAETTYGKNIAAATGTPRTGTDPLVLLAMILSIGALVNLKLLAKEA